jgi:alkylation response protein AidB-like acyl-CoA dehydrogenase
MNTPELILGHGDALAEKLKDGAISRDQSGEPPLDVLGMFANSGLLGRAVSPRYWPALLEVTARLAAADASVGELFAMHTGALAVVATRADVTERQRILAEVAVGAWLGGTLDAGLTSSPRDAFSLRSVGNGGTVLEGPTQLLLGPPSSRWLVVGVGCSGLDAPDASPVLLLELVEQLEDINEPRFAPFGQRGSAHRIASASSPVRVRGHLLEPGANHDEEARLLAFVHCLASAVHLGIATNALSEGVDYLHHRARPWIDADVETAVEDPLTIRRYGELVTRVHALQEMLLEAGFLMGESRDGAAALTFAREWHAFARRTSVEVASGVIELGGTSAADARFAFDRHWRNARALTLHVDVRAIDGVLGQHAPHEGVWPSSSRPFLGLNQGESR